MQRDLCEHCRDASAARHRIQLRAAGAVGIAGVSFAGRAPDETIEVGCTLVGCTSGTGISAPDIAYAAPEVARVKYCVARRCRVVTRFAEGSIRDFKAIGGDDPVPVTAELLDARGRAVARDKIVVTRTSNAPNGERCGPICHVGSVELTPTGRLVKPSARLRLPRPGRPGIHVIVRGRVTRVSAGRAATAPLVVRRGDPIEVRTDSRSYVRVYVRGHLPPAEWNPFGLARPDGRVWDAWVPRRLRGARELMVRLDHRRDGRVVRLRVPIAVIT